MAFFAAIGGFLFGYDTGVISGAMIPLKKKFNLSKELQEVVVSITIAGAILGSITSGYFNGRFGRRPVLLLASIVFTAGSVLMGTANTVTQLLFGRVTVGLGIGKICFMRIEEFYKMPPCVCTCLVLLMHGNVYIFFIFYVKFLKISHIIPVLIL